MPRDYRPRPGHVSTTFSMEEFTNREFREYCVGLRLWQDADTDVPLTVAMNQQGEETVELAIASALREQGIDYDRSN